MLNGDALGGVEKDGAVAQDTADADARVVLLMTQSRQGCCPEPF